MRRARAASSSLRSWRFSRGRRADRMPRQLRSRRRSIARCARRASLATARRPSPSTCGRDGRSSPRTPTRRSFRRRPRSSRSRSPRCTCSARAFASTPRSSASAPGRGVSGAATSSSSGSATRRSPGRIWTGSHAASRRRGSRRIEGRVLGDDTYFDTRRDALGWKPSYLGIESRPLSALSVGGLPFAGANGSAAAAARAFTEALEQPRDRRRRTAGCGSSSGDAVPHRLRPLAAAASTSSR